MIDPTDRTSDNPRIAQILERVRGATAGPLRHDGANRICIDDGTEVGGDEIGEAASDGDARLWTHSRDDILYLLGLIELLMTGMTPYRLVVLRRVMLGHGDTWLSRPVSRSRLDDAQWQFRDGAIPGQSDVEYLIDVGFLSVQRIERGDRLVDTAKITKSGRAVLRHATFE